MTPGDTILYASLAASVVALAGLLLKELIGKRPSIFGNSNDLSELSDHVTRLSTPLIYLATALLVSAYALITYYFVTGDYTYDYVWQYSSRELPLIYKISGVWAGQPGTYLLWVLVIFLSASWLAKTTGHLTALSRRTQVITIMVGIYFIVLTLIQSPFQTIYELPNVPPGFVPPDGSGLNALLVNFWMIVHPPVLFIGYAGMTIPFAAAIVYLLTKEDGWEELSRQWVRFTWLFLSLGIAIGGVWAYVVLGWGGFWAWDPVETASLVPWLALTGYLHAAALHRKNKNTFSIAAPMLAAASFILVIYAALVVRSGLFNSVHAFGDSSTGTLLVGLIFVSTFVSLGLGVGRYLKESETPESEDNRGLLTKTNIFYATLLLFIVLTFISFWGITFPVIMQLTQGIKYGIASDTKNFFNVWSYPFTILLLLAVGFCLNYKESEKEKQIKTLAIVAGISVLSMFLRTENFYVLDHNSPFFVSEPFIYRTIGSISLVSIFPSMIYALVGTADRLMEYLKLKSLRPKVKGIGLAIVHFGIVLILFGAVISSTQTQTMQANLPLSEKGRLVSIADGYGIMVQDYSTRSLTGNSDEITLPGVRISEILNDPGKYANNNIEVSGEVKKVVKVQTETSPVTYTSYFELNDGTGNLWAATQAPEPITTITEGLKLRVNGFIMTGFTSPSTNTTYNMIVFSSLDQIGEVSGGGSGQYKVQSVQLEVYKDNKKIGKGIAEYLEGKGSGTFPMVDPDITGRDIYVIFQGASGNVVPVTLKIIPAINFTWIGIIFFAVGIILIMAVRSKKG